MRSRLIVAAVAVPVLFVIMFFLPPIFMAGLVAVICAFVVPEFTRAACPDAPALLRISAIVFAALMPLGVLFKNGGGLLAVGLVEVFYIFAVGIIRFEKERAVPLADLLKCLFIGLIYPAMMSCLVLLKNGEIGRLLVLLPVVVTWCCDSAAYFAGVYLGKHKVTRLVSPHKSAEGFIGGILGGVLCTVLYGLIVSLTGAAYISIIGLIICGFVGSIACELGDLAYSLIKRETGIKDYGKLIPGHGGMLDRFDSMSFVAPAVWVLYLIIPIFTKVG